MSSSPDDFNSVPPSPSTEWDQISENDLDAALDRATRLAGNLANEVSESAPSAPDAVPDNLTSLQPRDTGTEIEQLDQLLSETQRQIGQNEKDDRADSDASERLPTQSPVESSESARHPVPIPDFMSEFTQPEPTGSSTSESGGPSNEIVRSFDSPESASSEVATAQLGTAQSEAVSTATLPKTEAAGESTIQPDDRFTSLRQRGIRIISDRVSPAASRVCGSGVRVLEAIDRPFAKVNSRVRSVLGWAGMILLAAAIVVLLFARR